MKTFAVLFFFLLSSACGFAQWQQTSGPSGGGVTDFAFVGDTILAATFDIGSGVFASTDGGTTWHQSGLEGKRLTCIAANGNTVLAASTQNLYSETDTVYQSSDGGNTWKLVMQLPAISGVRSIAYFKGQWYCTAQGNGGGLFISWDDGLHWVQKKPLDFDFTMPIPLVATPMALIAGSDILGVPVILYSYDGDVWTPAQSDSMRQAYCGVYSGGTIWLGSVGGVMSSSNNGITWSRPRNNGIEEPRGEYFKRLAVSGNHLIAISSRNVIYYSWNSGVDWAKYIGNGVPANASSFYSVAIHNTTSYLGSSTGVLVAPQDGSLWQYSSNGLRTADITALASNGGKIFAETERGVFYTSDQGANWREPQNINDLNDIKISGFLSSTSKFYAYGDGVYSWGGSTWTLMNSEQCTGMSEGTFGKLYSTHPGDDPITGVGGLDVSIDQGATWTPAITTTNSFDTEIYFLPKCLSSNTDYTVAIERMLFNKDFISKYFIYRTTDNGSSWSSAESPYTPSLVYNADNVFYLGTYGSGLFHSEDQGATFRRFTGLPAATNITALVKVSGTLFATVVGNGSNVNGLYRSADNGATWSFANDNTANISGELTADDTYLYSGGPSVWKRNLSGLSVNDKQTAAALQMENYPNPAIRTTTITIRTDGGKATLAVFDAKGELLRTYFNGIAASGEQTITCSTEGLASGTYFLRLESGGNTLVKEMVVLK